ncbi:kelch-like protein 3 isoform X9 [Heterodontus francisci]|uniref:kelch-like protein 3 isoform X9 n=1 Tax=Heterodontus francisci TaxID=7792 RepID=UPI00355B0B5B
MNPCNTVRNAAESRSGGRCPGASSAKSSPARTVDLNEDDKDQAPVTMNPFHMMKAFKVMNELRSKTTLCDVTIVAEDVEIEAHRIVLAACSPYFCAMFTDLTIRWRLRRSVRRWQVSMSVFKTRGRSKHFKAFLGDMAESKAKKVEIKDIDGHTLSKLIDYIYTAEVEVTEDNVQVLLPAASLLQLMDVRTACCDFLQSQLHPTNCLGIRAFADVHTCTELLNEANAYAEQHFPDVMLGEEFLSLNLDQVCSLISSDKLTVASEEKVMIVVGGQAPKAIRSVECYDFKEDRWNQVAELPSRRCRAGVVYMSGRVYAVGGFNGSLRVRTVDVYDAVKDHWTSIASMQERRSTLGAAVLNDLLYAVGGFDGSTGLSSVEAYNYKINEWFFVAPMNTRRSSVGVGVVEGRLYAVGGYDGASRQCLSTVEAYNPVSNEWTYVSDMSTRRSGADIQEMQAVMEEQEDSEDEDTLSQFLTQFHTQSHQPSGYRLGGKRAGKIVAEGIGREAQRLSTTMGHCQWREQQRLSCSLTRGVGVLNGQLYATGGHDGPLVRKSVEVYDPSANTWRQVADMNMCRRNAGVCAVNGFLYVVGGDDGSSNLSSVEFYNSITDKWTLLPTNMSTGRSYAEQYHFKGLRLHLCS